MFMESSAMEGRWKVKFRNVAQMYFPQTRVECRYTIGSGHSWSSRDWIGIFKVGWTSLRDYHTYVWALAPEDYTSGRDVNCSIVFQPSYLPGPGGTEYQFVYVDEMGEVCAMSPQFSFSAPKPLDELVTLEEQNNGEENEGEDLLLVVPKAQILQHHLEACQKELTELHRTLDEAHTEVEKQQERNTMERTEFETERADLKKEIRELRERLTSSMEKIENLQEKEKDVLKCHENISLEFSGVLAERAEKLQKIKDLEEELTNLMQHKQEAEVELDRMRERVKKMTVQRKEEEDERRNLLIESKRCREELQVLQERLENSDQSSEALRRDLSELGSLQSQNHTELHQIRLQAAQTALQLSQANLNLREGQAAWAKERENMRKNAELDKERVQKLSHELQKKEEWLEEERAEREKLELELGNEKASNRELRASLRAMQKEREQHQLEKQELLDHIRVLQLRMERETDAKWNKDATSTSNMSLVNSHSSSRPLHDDHEEAPEIKGLIQTEVEDKNEEELLNTDSDRVPVLLDPNSNEKERSLIQSEI
ncbi:calcium-binding and coiled-coil domain-containing protein 1b isoform X2 [Trichomycterus rosablanca]|uniref:calcium-binding and coiled-coil domain-containing protein 1b isoform X2 n=1 Tax=Trichomycterus rosablanca TaxID=2290929 RepID=UPI002F34F44A